MTYAEAKESKNDYIGKEVNFTMCGDFVSGTIVKAEVVTIGNAYEIDCTIQKEKGKEWFTVTELLELKAF